MEFERLGVSHCTGPDPSMVLFREFKERFSFAMWEA